MRQCVQLISVLSSLSLLAAACAPTLDSVKLVAYDRDWATQNKDPLIKAWQAAVGL